MGFYSIYKIIKDVIRTLFGNKFLKLFIITTIILILMFVLNERGVFAVTSDTLTTVTLNNSEYDVDLNYLTSQYNYYIFCWSKARSGSYYYSYLDLFCSNDQMTFYKSGTNTGVIAKDGSSLIDFKVFRSTNSSYSFNNAVSTWNNIVFDPSLNTYTYSSGNGYNVNQILASATYPPDLNITLANYDVKNQNNEIIFNNNVYIPPSLSNSLSQLENLNFSNFIINANSYTDEIENNDGTLFMLFYNRSLSNPQTTDGLYPIKEKGFTKGSIYTDVNNSTSSNMVFSFPIFKSGVLFNVGSTYEIRFAKKVYNSEYNRMVYEYLGDPIQFTISSNVTQDYINQLNQQTATTTDNEDMQDLQNSIDNQTQSIDNINNSITDSNVDNSSIDLPTDNTINPTQSGIDNIFQAIYNGFTSGTPQDIVFPLPYSNNNITIKPNYVSQMLNSSERRQNCLLSYSSFLLVRDK